jgi:hypothetical protein
MSYLGLALGSLAGLSVVYFGSDRVSDSMTKRHGVKSAEYRLVLYCWFQYLLFFGLLIYGWSAYYKWHWSIPILGTFIFGFGAAILFVILSSNFANGVYASKLSHWLFISWLNSL